MTAQGKPDRCLTCGSAPCQHEPSPVPVAAPTHDSTHFCDKHPGWRYPCVQCAKPSAPQAENVPSGKIAWPQHLDKVTLNPEIHAAAKEYMNSTWRSEGHWTEFIAYFAERMIASQTAALALKYACTKMTCDKIGKLLGVVDNVNGFSGDELVAKVAALAAELAGSREGHRITGDCLKESLERVAELERSNSLLRERLNAIEKILRENERDGFGFCDNCLEFAPNHDENCWLAILLQNKENQ